MRTDRSRSPPPADIASLAESLKGGKGGVPTAVVPPSPPGDTEYFEYLGWERDTGTVAGTPYDTREGLVAATRHEIDFPLQLGAIKVVPYALGEVAYWQQDVTGADLTRAYGQTGVRASLPLWKADPAVQSILLNLNGMAHKVTLDAEFYYADAGRDSPAPGTRFLAPAGITSPAPRGARGASRRRELTSPPGG